MNTTKKIKIIDFKLKKSIWNMLFWLYKSKFHWNWINFEKHKEYVFWDSIKNIDWKASSKSEKIFSKVFEEEKEIEVLFLVDLNSSIFFWKKKELIEEVFYALAFSSYKSWDKYAVLTFDWKKEEFFWYKKDLSNILNFFDKLEKLEKNNFLIENRLDKTLDFLVKNKYSNNLIFILTDTILENENKNLKILSLKNEIIFINIFDEIENFISKKNENFIFNSWKKSLELNLENKKIEDFNEFRKKKLLNFKNILKKNKIWYIYIDSSKDSFKEIANYFTKI